MKVVIATNNKHKVEEIETALDFPGWEFLTLSQVESYPEPEEDADTFVGNALIKARAAHEATGMAALADDSGLVVDALDGRPGVYSARYSGVHGDDEANNDKLLEELKDVPDEKRTARYACAMALCRPGREPLIARGTCEGRILRERRGEGGFGYDPLFLSADFDKTFAEATMEEKNAVSHRARAIKALLELM